MADARTISAPESSSSTTIHFYYNYCEKMLKRWKFCPKWSTIDLLLFVLFLFFYAVLEKWVHLRTSPLFLSNLPVFQRHLSVIRHECTTEMLSIAQMSTSACFCSSNIVKVLSFRYHRQNMSIQSQKNDWTTLNHNLILIHEFCLAILFSCAKSFWQKKQSCFY